MFERAPGPGARTLPGAGRPGLCRGGLLLICFLALPSAAFAASVLDLVQDTPAIRKKYRMEIVGFSTEMALPALNEESSNSADPLWLARDKLLELGENEKADAQLDALASWRMTTGRENLVPYAALLMRETFREADAGNKDRAATLLGYAVRLAPDYPSVHLAEGYLALKRSALGVAGLLQGVAAAGRSLVRDPAHLSTLIGRLSIAAATIILIVAIVWVASLNLRYAVHLGHDLSELLGGGRRLHSGLKRFVVLLLAAGFLVAFMSPLWLLVLGLSVSWAYQNGRERALSALLTLLVAALPLLAWLASSSFSFMGNELNQALLAVRNGTENQSQVNSLEKTLAESPDDAAAAFSLAQHEWRTGNLPRAEELFRRLRGTGGPLKVGAIINLGNMLMARGDQQGAGELYREAIAIRSDSAAAHYNLGQLLSLQFQFQEGEGELQRAMALDKGLISRQPATSAGVRASQYPVVENIPRAVMMERLVRWSELGSLRTEGVDLWNLMLTGLPARGFPVGVALLAILGLFHAAFVRRRGLTRRCQKCGRPFCPQCLPGGSKAAICPQCQHIFLVKEGIESAMRVEKLMEIRNHLKRRRLLGVGLAAVLPGGGHVFFGRTGAGFALALLSAVFLVALAGWKGPFIEFNSLAFPWTVFFVRVGLACFAAVYLASLVGAWRTGERER